LGRPGVLGVATTGKSVEGEDTSIETNCPGVPQFVEERGRGDREMKRNSAGGTKREVPDIVEEADKKMVIRDQGREGKGVPDGRGGKIKRGTGKG